jgi:hypothetical protein
MQIDSLRARPNSELPVESKAKPAAPRPAAAQNEPPAAERSAASAVPFPQPERVTVSLDPTRELVYRFLDPKTGEVVSQVPPEQVLEIVRGIQDLLRSADRSDATRDARSKLPTVNLRG